MLQMFTGSTQRDNDVGSRTVGMDKYGHERAGWEQEILCCPEAVDVPPLETFCVRLDQALSNMMELWVSLFHCEGVGSVGH